MYVFQLHVDMKEMQFFGQVGIYKRFILSFHVPSLASLHVSDLFPWCWFLLPSTRYIIVLCILELVLLYPFGYSLIMPVRIDIKVVPV